MFLRLPVDSRWITILKGKKAKSRGGVRRRMRECGKHVGDGVVLLALFKSQSQGEAVGVGGVR